MKKNVGSPLWAKKSLLQHRSDSQEHDEGEVEQKHYANDFQLVCQYSGATQDRRNK